MSNPKAPDLRGMRFGRLVVVEHVNGDERGALWRCKCDCGGEITKYASRIKQAKVPGCKSCEYERRGASHVTHGQARKMKETHLYRIWRGMISRCTYERDKNYCRYGGRGIKITEAWSDFANFRDWSVSHGYDPGLSIERIDPDGNYCSANCEWITLAENKRRMWSARSPEEQLRRRQVNWQHRRINQASARVRKNGEFAAAMMSFGC